MAPGTDMATDQRLDCVFKQNSRAAVCWPCSYDTQLDMAVGFYIPGDITSCETRFVKFATCLWISCVLCTLFFLKHQPFWKASIVKCVFRWRQGKCPTTSIIIDSDIDIAKDLPLISVLMLLLQKSHPWYQYWYCYCKRPSGGIDIDIAIAKHPLLVSILILLLHNTLLCYRYQYCYCILPVTGVAIVIAIDKWSANYRVSNNIKKIIIAQPCFKHMRDPKIDVWGFCWPCIPNLMVPTSNI